ncbi:MAG: RNA polymerase sigma factor [Bacteroidales bacterium]|nr:RNA polymerase sigma factor [Bacteroidales bacterium]
MNKDLEYVEKVLAGNTRAYSYLVDKYRNMVFTIIVKILGNEEDAEDLSQEVFLKVYKSLGTFKRKSKFSTWIYRIAYNEAITKTRKRKHVIQGLENDIIENYTKDKATESLYELSSDKQKLLLEEVLQKLPENGYIIITLYYKEDFSVKEISKITGMSESNVKVTLHRTRSKMQRLMYVLMKENLISKEL